MRCGRGIGLGDRSWEVSSWFEAAEEARLETVPHTSGWADQRIPGGLGNGARLEDLRKLLKMFGINS